MAPHQDAHGRERLGENSLKTLVLSDHTKDKSNEAFQKRQDAYDKDQSKRTLSEYDRDTEKFERNWQVSMAYEEKAYFTMAWRLLVNAIKPLPKLAPHPVMQRPGHDEQVWQAGGKGEKNVASFLGERLDDSWVMVSGYRTGKGEIDQVLVGPPGVFAVEVKHLNGIVSCHYDYWTRSKRDSYGNMVKHDEIVEDKKGRSPSRQINDAADSLQRMLDQKFGKGRVKRAVILSHPSAELGKIDSLTVDFLGCLSDSALIGFLGHEKQITPERVEEIVVAISADHTARQSSRNRNAERAI